MKKEKLTDGLSPESAAWVKTVTATWVLEPHHKKLLVLAAAHWDRIQAARRIIEKDGATYLDRFSQPKLRPETQLERDSTVVFARLLREMALDLVEAPESPRSAGFVGKGKRR